METSEIWKYTFCKGSARLGMARQKFNLTFADDAFGREPLANLNQTGRPIDCSSFLFVSQCQTLLQSIHSGAYQGQ